MGAYFDFRIYLLTNI